MFDSCRLSPIAAASVEVPHYYSSSATEDHSSGRLRFVLTRTVLAAVAWFLTVMWLVYTGLKVDAVFAMETGALVVLLTLALTIANLAIERHTVAKSSA